MGLKHADGQAQRGVHRHDPQQPAAQLDLLRRQFAAEDPLALQRQQKAQRQQRRPQHRIGHQKHPVELGHILFVAGHLVPGIVAHIGAAQTQTHKAQVRNDRQHQVINRVFAAAQAIHHHRRVDQRYDNAQSHGKIGQDGSRPDLIDFQSINSLYKSGTNPPKRIHPQHTDILYRTVLLL